MTTEIKSEFIRAKLKGKSLKNKRYVAYVQDLLYIEDMALNRVHNFGAAMRLEREKSAHPKEYAAIMKELAPKTYQRELEWKKEGREEAKRTAELVEKANQKRDAELKRLWLDNGGSV